MMSQIIGMLKMIVIGMIMFSFNPWTYFGSDVLGSTPSIVTWAYENKIYACLMTFFLCNMVETQLISSGAFEVTVNGEKGNIIWYFHWGLIFNFLFTVNCWSLSSV